MSNEEVVTLLKQATNGLYFMSESDYPFVVFDFGNVGEVSIEELKIKANEASDSAVTKVGLDQFFGSSMRSYPGESDSVRQLKDRYRSLVGLIKSELEDVTVYKFGRVNMPVFILGRTREGNWIGVSTRVVET